MAEILADTLLTASVERLAAALRRVTACSDVHAARLALALVEEGAVVPAASLADDEVLVERFLSEWSRPYFGDDASNAVAAVSRALAAALEER